MLSVLAGCKRESMCTRVQGRWVGERVDGVEGIVPELAQAARRAAQSERWTITATRIERVTGAETIVRSEAREDACVVSLRREGAGVERPRVMQLSVAEDGMLRAALADGVQMPTIVLRRAE